MNKFCKISYHWKFEIIDCVINHPSIWAEKTEGVLFGNQFIMKKPIYNWVLANPVLYEKPILNVKETFLWDPTPNQECMVCDKGFFWSRCRILL
jgi:hypothetical protein